MNNTLYHVSSKASSKRKYLGDAEDPHFHPSSPIISRQSLSLEQEEELTRSCTLVLSGVQHADDVEEDPLMKYITNHIAPKQVKSSHRKEKPISTKVAAVAGSDAGHKTHKVRRINDDTATPSETSKRDTIDRTNTSTPLTVLSETIHRPPSTRQNTALRTDPKSSKTYNRSTKAEKSGSEELQRGVLNATKSTSCLSNSQPIRNEQSVNTVARKLGNINISHMEFNKSLPSLPRYKAADSSEKQSKGLYRIFTTTKNKGVTSSDIKAPSSQSTEVDAGDKTPVPEKSRRYIFNLRSIFDRKKR